MADMREEIGATPHAAKKSKFDVGAAAKHPKAAPVPRASDVRTEAGAALKLPPPPARLDGWLGSPELVIAIDIETHDWARQTQTLTRPT